MPLPAAWTTVPVEWALSGQDATPCQGVVVFTTSQAVQIDGDTYVPEPISANVVDGVMEAVSIPATDDPDITPTGWTWRVAALVNPPGPEPFDITVPVATVGNLNLGTVVPVESATPLAAAALADSALADIVEDTDSQIAAALSARFDGVLAIARDQSDTEWPINIGGFTAPWPGMMVTIPPVTRPVELSYQAYAKVTQVGVGIFGFTLWETTSGAGVDIGANTIHLIDKAGVFEGLRHFQGSTVVQPLAVPAWRSFRLVAGLFLQSGSTGTAVTSKSGATNNRSAHLTAVQL